MGDGSQIGVYTGQAADAAVDSATAAEQYAAIDQDFRATIAQVSEAVAEAQVAMGLSSFCEQRVDDLVRLRAHMQGIADDTSAAGRPRPRPTEATPNALRRGLSDRSDATMP